MLKGKLFLAPIKDPKRILDIGTGTGIWAMEMGNDLSPIQPRWVPPNVRFEVDDVEADWTFTAPGGYAEFIDLDLEWRSPDNSIKEDSACKKANDEFLAATREAGIEPAPGPKLEGWLKDAGFLDVQHEKFPLPFGTWPADKHLKEIGAWNYLQLMEGVESFLYALFTRRLGYTKEEVELLCTRIKKEMKDPKLHAMVYMHVVYGKKAEEKDTSAEE
ncbi:hypothetical protein MMC24_004489 [Lignoscripta atroalba]|nr:hypothetical protein [Lignoscripta atroalba]